MLRSAIGSRQDLPCREFNVPMLDAREANGSIVALTTTGVLSLVCAHEGHRLMTRPLLADALLHELLG
jgi:hypothetical protein